MAIKLDMMKAYDLVSWSYLEFRLHKFLFPERFIRLIMNCVMTTSISMLVNGELSSWFYPTLDLRQGNSLSPFLFIICMASFSGLINQYNRHNGWRGIRMGNLGFELIHMFFADDVILFGETIVSNLHNI